MQLIASPAHFKVIHSKQQTVGVAVALMTQLDPVTDLPMKMPEQIFVQALSTNTASIMLGNASVTAGGAGFELPPGANFSLPNNDPRGWYVISSAAAQKLNINYLGGII